MKYLINSNITTVFQCWQMYETMCAGRTGTGWGHVATL